MTLLGIYREAACSPGRHLENDAAILELVATALERRGHRVALAAADAAERAGTDAALVFSMSRSPRALQLLARWAQEGRIVVNHPEAVLATARDRLAGATLDAVSLPSAYVVPTARSLRGAIVELTAGGWWVKGGDLYASRREDVHRVESMIGLDEVLDDFERRGLSSALIQEHVTGREIKFYAAGASGFFHCLDTATGSDNTSSFADIRHDAVACGLALGLEIFGGDLIVREDGRPMLVDLNDWPSFAPCRDEAAQAIAVHLESRLAARYAVASPAGSEAPSPA